MNPPIRLLTEATGMSREDVVARVQHQAKLFFRDRPHRLSGVIDVRVDSYVRSMHDAQAQIVWEATAYYESEGT